MSVMKSRMRLENTQRIWFRSLWGLVVGVVCVLLAGGGNPVHACRVLEKPDDLEHVFWVHLEGPCSSSERQMLAVSGSDLLAALGEGKSLDLQGVVVIGEVMLDQLPLQPVAGLSGIPVPLQGELAQRNIQDVRFIPGSIRLRQTTFENVLATNLSEGALVIAGKVDVSKSTFLQSVDFSKTIFLQPARFTGMQVDYEGFFIGARFVNGADFTNAHFGTHSRFHKAVFQGPATFANTRFKGLAEFLEVVFYKETTFLRAIFSSGTGFSGSVFHEAVDFSDAVFMHEVYFRFSEFHDRSLFVRSDFQKAVDLSNSQFAVPADFSYVSFAVRPDSAGSNVKIPPLTRKSWNDPAVQMVILACVLVLFLLHNWRSRAKA